MTKLLINNGSVRITSGGTIDSYYDQVIDELHRKYHDYPTMLKNHLSDDNLQEGGEFASGKCSGSTPIGKLVV